VRRIKRRPALRPPTDEEIIRLTAADLVAQRVSLGISPAEVLARIGYTYERTPREDRLGLDAQQWATYRLAVLEAELAEDGRLSTFQRYARAVGAAVRVNLGTATGQNRARMRRVKWVAGRRRVVRTRFAKRVVNQQMLRRLGPPRRRIPLR